MKEFFTVIVSIVVAVFLVVGVVSLVRPPYEVRVQQRAERFKFMSNDEIISETRKCQDAGLGAKEETNYLGDKLGWRIIGITCRPKQEDTQTSKQNIKKSNITTVNIDKDLLSTQSVDKK